MLCVAGFYRVRGFTRDDFARQRIMSAHLCPTTGEFGAPIRPRYLPDAQRLLRATNDYFCAGAVWTRHAGQWTVSQAAPCLHFLRSLSSSAAKLELARRGYTWEWLDNFPVPACSAAGKSSLDNRG